MAGGLYRWQKKMMMANVDVLLSLIHI